MPAVNLAREALEAARSPAERTLAQHVLGEALLHVALDASDPAVALGHLTEALHHDPTSSRLAFYRALALLRLGRPEGRADLEGSLDSGDWHPPEGTAGYARQLARVVAGQRWSASGLSEAEARDLRHIQDLLPPGDGAGGEDRHGSASMQLALFRAEPAAGADPAGSSAMAFRSAASAWRALLALKRDGDGAWLEELEEVAGRVTPKAAQARLRYYQGVAALRRGERKLAGELWRSAALAGLGTPWLAENLGALLREEAVELAQAGRWQEVVRLAGRVPAGTGDRILGETIASAHDHLAHDAAVAGRWSVAADHWREAEALDPRRAFAQNLALAEEALGNWTRAAEAWRAMARRRPRRPDHPDYLSGPQVAALWAHAADCYERADSDADALTCLETALKYAPDDRDLRLRRAEHLLGRESLAGAAEELDRLLALDPAHVETLRLRASVEDAGPDGDGAPFWRRVLEIAPRDTEARDALARSYMLRIATRRAGFLRSPKPLPLREQIRMVEEGTREVPDHPTLLVALGKLLRADGKRAKARGALLAALQAGPRSANVAGEVLHELLHALPEEQDTVEQVIVHCRGLPDLPGGFWLDQGEELLQCGLPVEWFGRFVEEALALVGRPGVEDSRASLLYRAWAVADDEGEPELAGDFEARIRKDVPLSGAVELLEARRLVEEREDRRGALRLLRRAESRAHRAGDPVLLQLVEMEGVRGLAPVEVLRMLEGLFG